MKDLLRGDLKYKEIPSKPLHFWGCPNFLGRLHLFESSSFLGSFSFLGTFFIFEVWAQLSLLLFVLLSCCSRYVGFIHLIHLNDLIDDGTFMYLTNKRPSSSTSMTWMMMTFIFLTNQRPWIFFRETVIRHTENRHTGQWAAAAKTPSTIKQHDNV